ncbi:4'-phosphopantetheinyl transferase NpgA/CfwA [Paecilomyces variotii No. 5]|uniref:holo-[acyl-carrier-protein] synthase n=1 Tax=Byssochlamys spectabilis (strain No. 5 / NBRC 109023) TaxID=1356009 RepID=V5HU44_BYSSN|nr:4'-phosphopantetheinyl transferase NpgA/CfwA [Paecilomyces variotii No. 5]
MPPSPSPSLTRWYIDTRPLTTPALPLLETLQPPDQESVQRFYQLPDRHMSLASNLLKYLFIHRTCRIPWSDITISRTPAPHRRPCFILPSQKQEDTPNVEFNVSHQAGLVALAGCVVPSSTSESTSSAPSGQAVEVDILSKSPNPESAPIRAIPQVGIDITCVDERSRRRKDSLPVTPQALAEFVDIFAEVFSNRELETIKRVPELESPEKLAQAVHEGLRLFYAYWALKEAYIKMTGEALLAPWLKQLEFTDVVAPGPVGGGGGASSGDDGSVFSEPYTGVKTWLYGKRVEDVRVEVVAFETDYLIATAARGGEIGAGSGNDAWRGLQRMDIEKDVAPCAKGLCRCLDR